MWWFWHWPVCGGIAPAPALAKQRRLLGFFAVLQVLTGLSNVVLDWPLVAAVLHTGGAAALVTIVVWSLAVTRANAVAAPTRNGAPPSLRHSVKE
jgi:heme A synthase